MAHLTGHLGPLSEDATARLIRRWSRDRPTVRGLVRAVGLAAGNPLFARELTMQADDGDAEMPVSLWGLVGKRLRDQPAAVREVLFAAASTRTPTTALLAAACGPRAVARLATAESADIVALGDRVRFRHPLLAAAACEAVVPSVQRRLHRRLAEVAGDVEDRARHLALATVDP